MTIELKKKKMSYSEREIPTQRDLNALYRIVFGHESVWDYLRR